MSALEHFSCLDELIQILYQGVDKFVVLSNATDEAWTISIGLEGPEGRWWQGKWEEDTILNTLVSHPIVLSILRHPDVDVDVGP